jgi:hypothetical protein
VPLTCIARQTTLGGFGPVAEGAADATGAVALGALALVAGSGFFSPLHELTHVAVASARTVLSRV